MSLLWNDVLVCVVFCLCNSRFSMLCVVLFMCSCLLVLF